ncbi:tol-pal system YbgF family protein [Parapedobacter deserti]|uniref:Tol-pal system YbgF family protein n=1 Tax=Parapedobacter deserti TaxID=1912957 RepID=A0ABV7JFN1_9SPHI
MEKDKEQLIEAYFAGELSAEAQQQLEWLLAHDTAFEEEFRFEKEIRDAVIYNERQQLKARFRMLDKQAAKPTRKLATWWYAAASILVLIGVAWFFFDRQPTVDSEKLYAQYMEPYPNVVAPRVRGSLEVDQVMAEALANYDKQAYAEAAALFEQLYKEAPSNHAALYLAVCRLLLDQPEQAIRLLENEDWADTQVSLPVIDWYLGLAYLKAGDEGQARQYISQVAASGSDLAPRAEELAEKLEVLE